MCTCGVEAQRKTVGGEETKEKLVPGDAGARNGKLEGSGSRAMQAVCRNTGKAQGGRSAGGRRHWARAPLQPLAGAGYKPLTFGRRLGSGDANGSRAWCGGQLSLAPRRVAGRGSTIMGVRLR